MRCVVWMLNYMGCSSSSSPIASLYVSIYCHRKTPRRDTQTIKCEITRELRATSHTSGAYQIIRYFSCVWLRALYII